jgi:hypothetical protein
MTRMGLTFALATLVMVVFTWVYFLREDIGRWLRERGPRRQLAREAAQERQQELARLRDELASKYLPPGSPEPPSPSP